MNKQFIKLLYNVSLIQKILELVDLEENKKQVLTGFYNLKIYAKILELANISQEKFNEADLKNDPLVLLKQITLEVKNNNYFINQLNFYILDLKKEVVDFFASNSTNQQKQQLFTYIDSIETKINKPHFNIK